MGRAWVLTALLAAIAAGACGQWPEGAAGPAGVEQRGVRSGQIKSITVGVTANIVAMSVTGEGTTAGGWQRLAELHSNGLVTAEPNSPNPTGRLAERAPALEDGSISMLPDGRMRVLYALRRGVRWHDGTPFTSSDMAFSYQMAQDRGLPALDRSSTNRIESVEAPDDDSFVLYFRGPYQLADSLWVRIFWPHPRHVLEPAYVSYQSTQDATALVNLPYWTSEYIHTGPFRLTRFEPGEGVTFEAYDQYFLGRPKIDVIRVRTFGDPNVLYTNLVSGAVDMFTEPTLSATLGFQLEAVWKENGQGTTYVVVGNHWFLMPQYRAAMQGEPANLEPGVRTALYMAIDRESLAEAVLSGHRELAIYSLVTPGFRTYEPTRDSLRRYAYEPARAKNAFEQAGWSVGGDGILHSGSDGRRFRTQVRTTPGESVAAIADYWRRAGVDVEEQTLSPAETQDGRVRSSLPGWELSRRGVGDGMLAALRGPVATAENGWTGNRYGYEDVTAERLVDAYFASISDRDQLRTIKDLSDFVSTQLPFLLLYYDARHIGVRKGISALEDFAGAMTLGTLARNSHLWDVQI